MVPQSHGIFFFLFFFRGGGGYKGRTSCFRVLAVPGEEHLVQPCSCVDAVESNRCPRNSVRKQTYSHQLPPVRPSSSPVSEFHMNFFQPPSSFFEGIFGLLPVKVLFFEFFFLKRRAPSVPLSNPDPLQRHPARPAQILPNINRWSPAPPVALNKLPSERAEQSRPIRGRAGRA